MTSYLISVQLKKAVISENQNAEISSCPAEVISSDPLSPLLLDQKKQGCALWKPTQLLVHSSHHSAQGNPPLQQTPLPQQEPARTMHLQNYKKSSKFKVFPEFREISFSLFQVVLLIFNQSLCKQKQTYQSNFF